MAGYDPAKGRFGGYAINQAERLMRDASQGAPGGREHFADTLTEFRKWAKTPIPIENERPDIPEEEGDIEETFEALAPQVWPSWDGKFNRTRSRWVYAGGAGRSHRANVQDPRYQYGDAEQPQLLLHLGDPRWPVSVLAGGRLRAPVPPSRPYKAGKGYRKMAQRKETELSIQVTTVSEKTAENTMKYTEANSERMRAPPTADGTKMAITTPARTLAGFILGTESYRAHLYPAVTAAATGGSHARVPLKRTNSCFPRNPHGEGQRGFASSAGSLLTEFVSFAKQQGARLTLAVGDRVVSGVGVAPVVTVRPTKLPYKVNDGLGLYDRRGHLLPESLLPQLVFRIPKMRSNTPFVCLKPLAGIYLVIEGEPPVRMGGGFIDNIDLRRMCPPRPLTINVFRRDTTTAHELRHSLSSLRQLPSYPTPEASSMARCCLMVKSPPGTHATAPSRVRLRGLVTRCPAGRRSSAGG